MCLKAHAMLETRTLNMFGETVACLRSKLVRTRKHANRSTQIETRKRNCSERSGLQFFIYRPVRNEGDPESLFNRILDRINVIGLQSKSTFGILLKKPFFSQSPGG